MFLGKVKLERPLTIQIILLLFCLLVINLLLNCYTYISACAINFFLTISVAGSKDLIFSFYLYLQYYIVRFLQYLNLETIAIYTLYAYFFHISLSQFVSISTYKKKGGSRTKSLKKENENTFSTEKKGWIHAQKQSRPFRQSDDYLFYSNLAQSLEITTSRR